jgi:REP element-mobilizing transposase RayT
MTYARKTLVSLNDTPYYHVVARCVRRAWLWGFDEYAGRDYSHRKTWVLERLAELTSIFTIEICAYAVLSNHYHLVVYVDQKRSRELTKADVVERWIRLYRAPPLVERWRNGLASEAECEAAKAIIENWRTRLCDLSWLMKCLNEHLARRANAEDNCDGRFWQGRFRSQALLDEAGLLTAMAYVDLNPIRAGIAETPEESEFTSIYERIRRAVGPRSNTKGKEKGDAPPQVPLRLFHSAEEGREAIPYRFEDYLALVDWTGRQIREDKRGHIDAHLPPIIQRLNIDHDAWCLAMRPRGNVFGRAMGKLNHLRLHASTLGQSWVKGVRTAERLYGART